MAKKMIKDMKVSDRNKLLAHKAGVDSTSKLVRNGMTPDNIKDIEQIRSRALKGTASASIKELFDKYKDKIDNGVQNNLEDYIFNNIIAIKRMIDNIIKYSDPRVFEVIPEDFRREAQDYGWVAQQYFDKLICKYAGTPVLVVPKNYLQCKHCLTYKSPKKFFKSSSKFDNEYTPYCKECCNELFSETLKQYKDIRETLIIVSHKLDLYIYEPVLEKFVKMYDESSGKQDIVDGQFLSKYIGELHLQQHYYPEMKKFTFEHSRFEGIPFKCIENYLPVPPIYHDKFEVEVIKEIRPEDELFDESDTKLSDSMERKLKYKFGNYPQSDLKWLEKRYMEWENSYDLSQLNTQKIIIQMCCDELLIVKQREQGMDVGKQWKTFLDSMKSLNLTPKQQAKENNQNAFASLSDFIKEVERHKPIVQKNKDLDDVDKIMRYVVAVSGAMARTIDKPNELTEAFDKLYKDYTFDIMDIEDSSDEMFNYDDSEEESEHVETEQQLQ